jgi:hypothetical protein
MVHAALLSLTCMLMYDLAYALLAGAALQACLLLAAQTAV